MNKSTLVLITLAALVLGWLVGTNLADSESPVDVPAGTDAVGVSVDRGGMPLFRYFTPDTVTIQRDVFGRAEPSTLGENFITEDRTYQTETLSITLETDAEAEYKALMREGEALVYSWTTDGGEVYFDFHAHNEAYGDEFFTRYVEDEGSSNAGVIVAPYTGQHGWYWLNLENEPLTITLKVAGFYDRIVEIDLD
jgi:hypothetical protein